MSRKCFLHRALLACSVVTLAAMSTGCNPPDLYPRLRPPQHPADGITWKQEQVRAFDALTLYEQSWHPAVESRAAVIVVHGQKDHGSRYAELIARLVHEGFTVYAPDLRGYAHSEGMRVYVGDFDDYLRDLDNLVQRVKQREPKKKLFIVGHSMGGLMTSLYAIDHPRDVDGIVLSAPALDLGVSGFTKVTAAVSGTLTPLAGVFNPDFRDFTRDPNVVRECEADPLIFQGSGPARTAAEFISATGRVQKRMDELDVPVLFLHGTADKLTRPEASRDFFRRAKTKDKTIKLYDGLYHDLVHEPERERVLGGVVAWLTARAPTP